MVRVVVPETEFKIPVQTVDALLRELSEQEKFLFMIVYELRKKHGWVLFIAWLFGPIIPFHFIYLGEKGKAIIYFLVFVIFFPAALVWWIVELFLLGKRIREYNETAGATLTRDAGMID